LARVIVVADHEHPRVSGTWMDETVTSVRLDSGHSAEQFVERLGWAIQDADAAQRRFVEALAPHSYRDVSS
jgi:hypothetical protein